MSEQPSSAEEMTTTASAPAAGGEGAAAETKVGGSKTKTKASFRAYYLCIAYTSQL